MLHLFLDKGPWFRSRSGGRGTGLPIAWQGWLLMLAHILLIAGIATLLRDRPMAMVVAVVLAGLAPLPIYRARTVRS